MAAPFQSNDSVLRYVAAGGLLFLFRLFKNAGTWAVYFAALCAAAFFSSESVSDKELQSAGSGTF